MIKAALLGGAALLAVVIQSASAADQGVRPVLKDPFVAAPVSHWDGLYASVSAGATSLRGDTSNSFTSTTLDNFATLDAIGGVTTAGTLRSVENDASSANARGTGAVFTFTMGYNVVWNSWLAGIQSEVSYNKVKTRMVGSFSNTNSNITTTTFPPGVLAPGVTNNTTNGTQENTLTSNWTISEMARLGYLVTREWLVYGLIGWSMSGFELDTSRTFTLTGVTWGAGIERDLGFLRAFLQFKGINYGGKDFPSGSVNSFSRISPFVGGSNVENSTTNSTGVQRISANQYFLTAGVTVPLNFTH